MLIGLARFTMQGRWQAASVVAAMSLLALMIPPVSYLAGGIIVLTTLRAGPKEGITVIGIATALFAVMNTVLPIEPWMAGLFVISSWLPMYGVTLVLGYTRSLTMSLIIAACVGLLLVVGTYIVLPDPTAWWLEMMAPLIGMLQEQPGWQLEPVETQAFLTALSTVMTGLIVAGLFTNVALGLLLGRAWQAGLYNPGGFADEFQQISLGKLLAVITVIVTLLAAVAGAEFVFVQNCLPILLALFAIQGVAVVHALVRQKQKHKAWLIVMYIVLFVMMPQMVFMLAITGVLEQWFNFRQRSVERGE